jgi:hypothetical protein
MYATRPPATTTGRVLRGTLCKLWRNTIGKTFGCVCPVFTHLGNQYDYVFDYNSPINSQSPDQVVEYILTGIANQKVDMSLIGGGE